MIQKLYAYICIIMLITMLTAFGMEKKITYPCDLCDNQKTELNYTVVTSKSKTCDHILCKECDFLIEKSHDQPIDFDPCILCSYMLRVNNKQCWKNLQKPINIGMQYHSCLAAEYFKTQHPNRTLIDVSDKIDKSYYTKDPLLSNDIIKYPCDNCREKKPQLNRFIRYDANFECTHILCENCTNTIDDLETLDDYDLCMYCNYFYYHNHKRCWQEVTEEKDTPLEINMNISAEYLFFNYPNRNLPDVSYETESLDNPHEELIPPISTEIITYDNNQPSQDVFDIEKFYESILYSDPSYLHNNEDDTHVSWNSEINEFWSEHSYFASFHKKQNQQYWQARQKHSINNNTNIQNAQINPAAPILLITYDQPVIQNPTTVSSAQPQQTQQHPVHSPQQGGSNPSNPPTTTINIDTHNPLKWFGAAGIVVVCCYGVYQLYMWLKNEEPHDEKQENDTQDLKEELPAT